MKKLILSMALLVLVLAGCDSDDTTTTPANTQPEANVEDVYLQVVHEQAPDTLAVPDGTLIGAAHDICAYLDDGLSILETMNEVLAAGVPSDVGGTIMGAGIVAFCPEYRADLDEAVDAYT